MPFFENDISKPKNFDKLFTINEIKNKVREEFPQYHIIDACEGEVWDFLVIRSIYRETKQIVGAFNHEKILNERFQQVFAISVDNGPPPENPELFNELANWVTQYIHTDHAAPVIRKLKH